MPVEAGDSRSSSDSSTKGCSGSLQPEHTHRMPYIGRDKSLPLPEQKEILKDPGKGMQLLKLKKKQTSNLKTYFKLVNHFV